MDRTEKSSQRAYFVRVVSESNQDRRALCHRPPRLSGSNRKRANCGPARRARDRHSHEVDTDIEMRFLGPRVPHESDLKVSAFQVLRQNRQPPRRVQRNA
jgi:hypothetical protein